MSEINTSVSQSLFHQRSQSMPLRHTFMNDNHSPLYQEDQEVSSPSYNFNGIHRSLKQESGITQNNDSFPITPPSKLTYSQYRPSISDDDNNSNFFYPSESTLDVFDKNNNRCPISLDCRLTKGFFKSDSHWTCYRRNYFQVTASLIIPNYSDLAQYTLGPERRHIKQFFVHVRACVVSADKGNSSVRLTQMTPKRDKGPVRDPPMIPICPTNYVTFERLQFKAATANNGRRKASQQFYCLVFDLSAQLEDETLHVVSTCTSMPLVVRGRSPGHYNCERKRIKSPKINEKSNESTPAPTYVYSPPPSEPSSLPISSVPHMMFTAFNPHGRSQSANDPQFLARHRKYQTESYQQSLFHDDSMAGIDKALKHWELQAAKFREESASAFHSYIPEGSEASTPTPYNNTLSHNNEDERPYYNWS